MMRSRPLFAPPSRRCLARMFTLFAVGACAAASSVASDHAPPPVKPATSYPAVDYHTKEQVAIAAVPCLTRDQCRFFHVDYLRYGFMPIRIIVTNLGDRPISLSDARILFVDSAGDRIQAAEPRDVERRIGYPGPNQRSIPVAGPIKLHLHSRNPASKVDSDFNEYEYAALAVEAHTTRAGYLFYDINGLGPNPLHGASLVLRELRNADGRQLFFFQIPLDKSPPPQH
ncbi:MAG TPA: hypothetical protein VME18_08120 [Acidobacteriaceae bacterium]|nr:hypothetical protein [Acidobacteriaceae bacterium]